MASSAKPQSVYKTYWNKYEDGVKEVATPVMEQAFRWLYEYERHKSKDPEDTTPIPYVGDFLETLPRGKKRFYKSQKAELKNKEPVDEMDITPLYTFLQRTCGLASEKDPVWNEDNDSLEYSLYLLKEERNCVDHEHRKKKSINMTFSELSDKLDNLRNLCSSIIYKAGQRAGRHRDEITQQTDNMSQDLREILGVDSKMFAQLAREEKEKQKQEEDVTGGTMCDDEYVRPIICRRNGVPLSLSQLFHSHTDDDSTEPTPQLILVTGDAGAGKTTLCRFVC